MSASKNPGLPCPHEDRARIVDGPDDSDQPCPHGDYRSCVVDGCRPLRRVHLAGVIVPPAAQVPCMWCGGGSLRGQCGPCAALLDAIHAAPRAGVAAIIDAARTEWDVQSTKGLRWVSWEQHGEAERAPDCRPMSWPPPAEVLAFWELAATRGADTYCTVVALVRAPSEQAAAAIIQGAWSPGIGEWRFNREYGKDGPPGDRFSPPRWSIKLGRWPWSRAFQQV